jgi:hypothetical protein
MAMDDGRLDREIAALRLVFLNDRGYAAPGHNQAAALGSLMNSGLTDHRRLLRLEVLKEITGLPQLESSLQLTAHTVSTLIAYLKRQEDWSLNENGIEFLQAVQARCAKRLPAPKERRRRSLEEGSAGTQRDAESSLEIFDDRQSGRRRCGNCHGISRGGRRRTQPIEERVDGRQGAVHSTRVAALLSRLRQAGALPGPARGDFDAW